MSINLLPWRDIQQNKKIKRRVVFYIVTLGFLFLISVFLRYGFIHKTEAINSKNVFLKKSIMKFSKSDFDTNNALLKKITEMNTEKSAATQRNENTKTLLSDIANALPPKMIFQSIKGDGQSLLIDGVSDTIADIHTYALRLQQNLAHKTVTLNELHSDSQHPAQFCFSIQIKP